ncbi:MAG TPA: metallophosphoesterase [Clostridiaceae bacterium]|nr:metallophosphoesterase [Clostridiaceae bacterium]
MFGMIRKFRKLIYILSFFIFIMLFLYWQNDTLQVTRYSLEYENIPDEFNGFRIVQISDMHGKTFGSKNSGLAKRIRKLRPDVLLVTGDMLSSTVNDGGAFIDFLDQFGNTCPVYMCLGNHEQIAKWLNDNGDIRVDYYDFINKVRERGVILLDNEKTTLTRGKSKIILAGLTLELYHYSRRDIEPYDENLSLTESYIDSVIGKKEDGFNIMLAHNPAYFKEYASWGADLVLSGHVHGGIIRIPFKGGLLSPERVFFPEYDAGLFELDDSKMIVNRGLGYSVINIRILNRPDVSFVEIIKR